MLSLVGIGVHIVEKLSCFVLLAKLDLLLELVLLFFHLVDAFDQIHVVLHEARIVFAMLLQTARQLNSVVLNVSLMSTALSCISIISINISFLAIGLFLHPGFVKANDSFLEFLVVLDVLDHFEDIVLEALLLQLLQVQFDATAEIFAFKTLVSHP